MSIARAVSRAQVSPDDVSQLLRGPYDASGDAAARVPILSVLWRIEGRRTTGYASLKPRAEVSPFD